MASSPPQDPLVGAFDRLLARSPAAPLVASGRRVVDRAGVAALARAASRLLEPSGLGVGHLVGLSAPNGPGFLAGLLALRRAGAAVLMLDHGAPAGEWQRAAQGLGARAVLSAEAWPEGPEGFRLSTLPAPHQTLPQAVGVVKLTSGSTGAPRGVSVSMEALLADDSALASSMGLRDDDRILGAIPLSHSYGLSSVALPVLVRGSLLVLSEEAQPLAPLQAARDGGATFFPTAPAYLQALLKMSRPPAWPPSIRLVISASAPLPPATAARFRETYAQPVHVFYGASECGGICYDRDGGAAERGTIGPPVDGVRVTLEMMDGAAGEDAGIVTVSSAAVAEGYLPEANPRLGSGRFVTSDVAVWQDGELALRGRIDGLINVKGKKVDPMEIQQVLEGLSGVDEVVALGVPAPENGGEVVRAVIACQPGRLSYTDVLAWCRSHLADHKVPRSVILVPAIPRNARGKISRSALAALEAPAGSTGG